MPRDNFNGKLIATLALSATVVYTITAPLRGISQLGLIPYFALIIAIIAVSVHIKRVLRITASRKTLLVGLLLILFVLIHQVLNSTYQLTTWSSLDIVTILYIVIPLFWLPSLLAGTNIHARGVIKRIMQSHLIITVIIGIIGLLIGFRIIADPLDMAFGMRLGIPFERTTYPIRSTSIYFVYIVPAAIYAFGRVLSNEHKGFYLISFGILAVISFLTAFRKVWLGIFFGIILFLLFYERTRKKTSYIIIALSPVLLLSLYLMHLVAPESTIYRIRSYKLVAEFAINNPLGIGQGGIKSIVDTTAHNILLAALSEYGIATFILLLMICVLSALQAFRVGMHSSDIVTMSLAASVIAMLIGLQFENNYALQRFWLLVGLFYAAADLDIANRALTRLNSGVFGASTSPDQN